nr:L-seryl-tRNA(Sec) selenium transferase [bacterium]
MTTDKRKKLLQSLPAVGESIHAPELAAVVDAFPRSLVVRALRDEIEHLRALILTGKVATVDAVSFYRAVQERIRRHDRPRLTRLINATGIVVHTNLGRSPLAEPAVAAVMQAARGYSNLEYDLAAGRRGSRTTLVEEILCELTGAEAALVVNNNAGAVLLALSSLAKDREAVVSRGELIEIGGSFRIPDVMAASGAMMVEVGTTNRTHLADYEKAINERTSLLLKVHTSNYRIQGFTKTVTGAELAELAHAKGVKAIEDLGSGCLTDTALPRSSIAL